MKKIFLIILSFAILKAYTLEQLKEEPNSLAKDYFIYKMLKNNEINESELADLKKHIFRYAGVIQKTYESLVPSTSLEDKNKCPQSTLSQMEKESPSCLLKTINNIDYAKKLNKDELLYYAKYFEKSRPDVSSMLKIMSSKDPVKESRTIGDGKTLMRLYYSGYKVEDFIPGPKTRAGMMEHSNAYKFVNSILVDNTYPKIRQGLARLDKEDAKEDLAFVLGLNALMENKVKLAEKYFLRASASYKYKRPRDNAIFFAYLASKNKKYLQELSKSDDLNIYSIYAKELTKTPLGKIEVPRPIESIDYPISDPLNQARFLKDLKTLDHNKLLELKDYFYKHNTLGQYLVVSNVLSNYKDNIYPIPFYEYLKDYPIEQQALILAIAMQESRFLPASVSVSYALGMMQFMPFVAIHTAKVDFNDNNFDETNMFKPEVAYKFANAHINTLKRGVNSPIFIAYAYNGGLTFTKRMLNKDYMFSKKSKFKKYEPFLSMELVPYLESRLYGKKVLANYYIYLKLLGQKPKMKKLFDDINKETDEKKVQSNK